MMKQLCRTSLLPPYLAYPRFLLRMDISETAKLIYVLLLDRARLSMKNDGWEDERGHVFIYYTIESLAEDCGKSQMTVKNVLAVLEQQGLIFRKRQGAGKANQIYVTVPTENCPTGQIVLQPQTDKKLSGNNNKRNNKGKRISNYNYEEEDSL